MKNDITTMSPRVCATALKQVVAVCKGKAQLGIVLLAMVALLASSAVAQLSGTGAISGQVTDPTGAVVGGATVTATDVATNVKTVRNTTGAGDYNITPLTPGTYTISVVAKGFQQLVQENITVDALATVGLPLRLTVGRADETVTVSTAPPLLSTQDAALGGVMDNDMYSSLPLMMGAGGNADQRRATDFEYLMPGVEQYNINTTSQSGIINGSGPGGNVSEIYIEGVNLPEADGVGDPRFTWTAIGVDAVDQFQVQTAGISSQYAGQGMQNYSVKSGGNAYHGSIYEYIRNTLFDSWSFLSKVPVITGVVPAGQSCTYLSSPSSYCAPGGVKPREIMNEVGIVLSGPIIKNRLFVFGNYGQYRYQQGARPTQMTFPHLDMLGLTSTGADLGYADYTGYAIANTKSAPTCNATTVAAGNLANQCVDIYDPASQVYNCNGTAGLGCNRNVFLSSLKNGTPSADIIPSSRFSAASKYYRQYLFPYEALASQSLYTNNLVYGTPIGLANWYSTGRIDYTVNQRNQIGIIIAFGRQASTGPNSGSGLNPPFNASQSYHPVTNIDIVKDTFTITPHLINQFAVGYGRYQSFSVTPNRTAAFSATGAGIVGMPDGQASDGFPAISFSGNDAPGAWGGYSWNNKINNTYTGTDTIQWTFGKHNLTIGGQVVDEQFNYSRNISNTGPMSFAFSSTQTAQYSSPTSGTGTNGNTGAPLASYLLGAVSSSSVSAGVPGLGTVWITPSFWGQDDFKVTSKLTLNLGLRWDIYPSIREKHNIFTFLNPNGINNITGNRGTLEFAGNGDPSIYCNCQRPSPIWWKNIAPRIGMAYSVNAKTVIRGSYNVNFARGNWTSGSQSGSPSTTGLTPAANAPSNLYGNAAPILYWDNTACSIGQADNVACGWTGSVTSPKPPLGGASLAEYLTTYTTALQNTGTGSITAWDPYRGSRTPEYINWTFGFQRQLDRNTSVTVSYVGSQGHFLSASGLNSSFNQRLNTSYLGLTGYNFNPSTSAVTPCSGSNCGNVPGTTNVSLLGAKSTAPAIAAWTAMGYVPRNPYSGGAGNYYTGNSAANYFYPFPQYSGVSDTTGFAGNTNFHALEVSLNERASHGLSFTINYTYSKSMDDLGGFRLVDNPRLDRSLSAADQPQNLVAFANYKLPFGHGHIGGDNFWANALAGGWTLAGIYSYHSGSPIAISGSGCAGGGILGTCYPSINPGNPARNGKQYGKNVTAAPTSPNYYANQMYLNYNAFTVLNAGTQGTVAPTPNPTSNYGTFTSNGQIYNVGAGPADYAYGNAPRTGAGNVWSQGFYNLDMNVKRVFHIYHEMNLSFEADAFNVTNHVIFGTVNGGVGTTTYGQVAGPGTANLPRDWQFSGRFSF